MEITQDKNNPNGGFNARLSDLIATSGLKQKDICTQTGISVSALAKYKVDRIPKSEELLKLARFFNVQMEWLLIGGENNLSESTKKELIAARNEFFHGVSRKKEGAALEGNHPLARLIPVISWAHAGEAESYDELPESWQEEVPTECQDEDAFGVKLLGDSMEPGFREGDLLVLMPNKRATNGSLVVCRFKNDGILFRRMELVQGTIRLVPLNKLYSPTNHREDEFSWIYPVWGRWTQIWK